jgi:hypothetical protein
MMVKLKFSEMVPQEKLMYGKKILRVGTRLEMSSQTQTQHRDK